MTTPLDFLMLLGDLFLFLALVGTLVAVYAIVHVLDNKWTRDEQALQPVPVPDAALHRVKTTPPIAAEPMIRQAA